MARSGPTGGAVPVMEFIDLDTREKVAVWPTSNIWCAQKR